MACTNVSDLVHDHFVQITDCKTGKVTVHETASKAWDGNLYFHYNLPLLVQVVLVALIVYLVLAAVMPLASAVVSSHWSKAVKTALPRTSRTSDR